MFNDNRLPEVACSPMQETMKLRLERRVNDAQSNLDDAKRVLEILNKNPELEELLNALRRMGF
jgi:uncharacterized protein YjgD (DUF1641 family)